MRIIIILRSLILTAVSVLLTLMAYGQITVTNGFLEKGFYMGFIPSADNSSLAYYEPLPTGKYNFAILNLKDFSVRRMEAFDVLALPTPDHKGQYWVQVPYGTNYDENKPNFKLHYSADGTLANKKVYEGTWYPFGFTADGNAIAADVSLKNTVDFLSVKNLRIVDPNTGAEIKSLVPGQLLTKAESQAGTWGQPFQFRAHEGKGVVARINLQTGDTKIFRFDGKPGSSYRSKYYVSRLNDTLLIGGSAYNPSLGHGELFAYGLMSGKRLLDSTYSNRIFAAGWVFANGHLWAIHQDTKGLTEYALTGGPLKALKVHPLDLSAVKFFSSSFPYQKLIVSKVANRVALLPDWMSPDGMGPVNEAYIWELSTGKLLHTISDFYKGAKFKPAVPAFSLDKMRADEKAYQAKVAADAAAKLAAGPCADEKAALKVKVGAYVREGKDGAIIQLKDYDCKTMRYVGEMRFANNKSLSTTTFPVNLFDVSSTISTPKYKVVSVRTCAKCNGAGTISGTRNYEKVDYGIYVKYTTTGTTAFTDLCKECRGNGLLSY